MTITGMTADTQTGDQCLESRPANEIQDFHPTDPSSWDEMEWRRTYILCPQWLDILQSRNTHFTSRLTVHYSSCNRTLLICRSSFLTVETLFTQIPYWPQVSCWRQKLRCSEMVTIVIIWPASLCINQIIINNGIQTIQIAMNINSLSSH